MKPAPKADALPGCATPRHADALRFSRHLAQAEKASIGKEGKNESGTCIGSPEIVPSNVLDLPRIHLIACCSSKRAGPAPARDLYTSDLFRKSVAYVEAIGAPWVVLSALHGIVMPDAVLAPYDVTLLSMSREQRRCWGEMAADALWRFDCREFVFLAGATYRQPMMDAQIWRARGYRATAPMQGLGIGEQKAWLAAQVAGRPAA